MARKTALQNCFCPPFSQNRQISSSLSKHCDLGSLCSNKSPSFNIVCQRFWCLNGLWLWFSGLGEKERKAFSKKSNNMFFKRADGKFLRASFPPFPLPSAYLNDMSSPNIQLLSWEFPPHTIAALWACGCQEGRVFSLLPSVLLINLTLHAWVHSCVCLVLCDSI